MRQLAAAAWPSAPRPRCSGISASRSRPASISSRRRSATSATSRCARFPCWRAPTSCCARTRATAARCCRTSASPRPTRPYHEHNAERERPRVLADLEAGRRVALISDAGTPLVSDPGYKLVRAAIDAGHRVEALPGPSAALAALERCRAADGRLLLRGLPAAQERGAAQRASASSRPCRRRSCSSRRRRAWRRRLPISPRCWATARRRSRAS